MTTQDTSGAGARATGGLLPVRRVTDSAGTGYGYTGTLEEFQPPEEGAPPAPFEGAPAKALRDMDETEIMNCTPSQFFLAWLADGCEDCDEGPRETCPYRMHCDAATYGV